MVVPIQTTKDCSLSLAGVSLCFSTPVLRPTSLGCPVNRPHLFKRFVASRQVLQERLGGKVDLSALDGKADRDALLQVTAEINDKVSQDVVARLEDELSKLKAQLSVLQSAGAADLAESAPWRSGQHSNYGGQPGDLHALLDQKANHADVQALRDALASLADQTIPGAGQGTALRPLTPEHTEVENHTTCIAFPIFYAG